MSDIGYVIESWIFVFNGIVSSLLFAAIVTAIALLGSLGRSRSNKRQYLFEVVRGGFIAVCMGVFAWVMGYLTGASRNPAVGDLIPAALGTIGTIGAFIGLRYGQTISTGMAIISFAFSLFIGAATGGRIRSMHEEMDSRLPPLELLYQEARKEALIKKYREELGLPWPPEPYGDREREKKPRKDK